MKLVVRRRLRSALRGFKIPETHESAALVDDGRERERLAALAKSGTPLRLHIGCGPRVLAGWVNIDLLAYPPFPSGTTREDFFAIDVTRGGLPLPDGCAEAVFHEDFIEHISQRDTVGFLAETHRVMVDGAVHRVNSPNLASSMRDHSNFTRGLAGTYTGEWDQWDHLNVLTPRYLEDLAAMVGYSRVEFNERNGSISPYVVDEIRPGGDRPEDGNIFADLVK